MTRRLENIKLPMLIPKHLITEKEGFEPSVLRPDPTGANDAAQIARTRLANDHVPDLAWFIDPVSARECRGMHGVGSDQP